MAFRLKSGSRKLKSWSMNTSNDRKRSILKVTTIIEYDIHEFFRRIMNFNDIIIFHFL